MRIHSANANLSRINIYTCPSDEINEINDKFFPGQTAASYAGVAGSVLESSRPLA